MQKALLVAAVFLELSRPSDGRGGAGGQVRGRSGPIAGSLGRGANARTSRNQANPTEDLTEDEGFFTTLTSDMSMPSSSPSAAPIATPCFLEATITCTTEHDMPCNTLTVVPSQDRTCNLSNLTSLGWAYSSKSCSEDNTTSVTLMCEDFNGGPDPSDAAFVTVTGNATGLVYFRDTVVVGDTVRMENLVNGVFQPLDSSVTVVVQSEDETGAIVQQMSFSSECTVTNDLTLAKSFGALTLTRYGNANMSFHATSSASWTFTVVNRGTNNADLVDSRATINGETVNVIPNTTDPILLFPGESFNSTIDDYLIDLLEPSSQRANALFAGRSPGGPACGASAFLHFDIA